MATTIPTGTVTFLFTDIEGSTRMWEAHPRAMQAVIARHDALLREAIETNSGYVFKTVGDAFCAAFPTAPQAVEAAIAVQRALQGTSWDGTGVIKVRMALHTGAAEVRDGDYFGLPLNRVARLLSTGHGGQILLSLATQQLVRDHLPEGVALKDLGEGGLKDLVRIEHVYQILAPGLPSDFPPLKSLDAQYLEPTSDQTSGRAPQNPYKGLRAFQESDAADFFGREVLVERLVARMAEEGPLCRFLAVVGPSGSGKSSVVRAGLVPALRQGKLPGSDRWLVVEMIPGAHPFEELDALLLSIAGQPPDTLMALLNEDERGLIRAAKRVLPRDESVELVLVIDQFEEVFTLVEDEPTRVHFLEILHAASTDPRSRVHVIVTLRADFFDRPLLYPDPGELMRQRTAVVLPLSAEELERAIVKPAQRVGVSLEPELLATIIKDVGEQPGALPLLQYALTELFERRAGRTLTLNAYQESGGVLGALARRADEIYGALTEEEQEAARQLFLRLITLGEGSEDTRRRVRRSELASIAGGTGTGTGTLDKVIEVYGRFRLLTFDMDPITKGPTVEVAHEALIRTWGRLQEWLEESRTDLRVQRQLMAASTEWAAAKRDPSFLATGARLTQFEALAEGANKPGGVALAAEEKEYLQASLEEQKKQERLEKERQAKELALQKRAASRLRVLVAGLAVFLVIAAILTLWALNQSQVAQDKATEADTQRGFAVQNAATAEANFNRAEAQRLASEANKLILTKGQAEIIGLLSISSMNTEYTTQGDDALAQASTLIYPKQIFIGHTDFMNDAAFSPDGKYIATVSHDKTARLWDAATGKELHQFTGFPSQVHAVAFSPDGKYLLTGSSLTQPGATEQGPARLWDIATGKEIRRFEGHTGSVWSAAYSRDGRYVLTGSRDKTARLWDVATGQQLQIFSGHTDILGAKGVALSPDGQYVATASWDHTLRLWDAQTGKELHQFEGFDGQESVAFSPDGKQLVTAASTVQIWDIAAGKELRHFSNEGGAGFLDAVFSPDGKYVAGASYDSSMLLWDAQSGALVHRYIGHTGGVQSVVFSPDGRYLLTAAGDHTVRLWEVQPISASPQFPAHDDKDSFAGGVAFSPDGKYILTGSGDNSLRLWDVATREVVRTFSGHTDYVGSVAFSPDGRWALSGSSDKTIRLWNVATGKELRMFSGPTQGLATVAFSPDGKQVLAVGRRGDYAVRLWDAQTGQATHTITMTSFANDQIMSAAYSPDGRYIVAIAPDPAKNNVFNRMLLLNPQTGQELRTFSVSPSGQESQEADIIDAIAVSPDGKYLLTGIGDNAQLWDATNGQELRTFTGHTDAVNSVEFSPDGKYVLTASADGTARLWETETGREVRRFSGHTSGVGAVAFSPDGKWIFTSDYDGVASLWRTDYKDAVHDLCSKLLRDFTNNERAQFEIKGNEPTCPKQ